MSTNPDHLSEHADTQPYAGLGAFETSPQEIDPTHTWESTPEAMLTTSIDIALRDCTDAQRTAIIDAMRTHDHIPLTEIAQTLGDASRARRIAKLGREVIGKSIETTSLVDRFRLAFTEPEGRPAGIGAARALQWFSEKTGRHDLRVTYPASGADKTGFLDHLGAAPVGNVDCITEGGPQGAPEKVYAQGIDARLVAKSLDAAIHDGDLLSHETDCLLIDLSGAGTIAEANDGSLQISPESLDYLLAPDGMIVATGGYLSTSSRPVRDALERLPPDQYRFVGTHGRDVFIVERVQSTATDAASKSIS